LELLNQTGRKKKFSDSLQVVSYVFYVKFAFVCIEHDKNRPELAKSLEGNLAVFSEAVAGDLRKGLGQLN